MFTTSASLFVWRNRIASLCHGFRLLSGVVGLLAAVATHAQDGYVFTTIAGKPGESGNTDGVGAEARFSGPGSLAFDASGALYVTDAGNRVIRKIILGAKAEVSTVPITADVSTDPDQPAPLFPMVPTSLCVASDGSAIFLDGLPGSVRKLKNGTLSTLHSYMREQINSGVQYLVPVADGGETLSLAMGPDGRISVGGIFRPAPNANPVPRIDRLRPDGSLISAWRGVTGTPLVMAADGPEDLVLIDADTCSLVRLTSSGDWTFLAGGLSGARDGTGAEASFNVVRIGDPYRFSGPGGIAVDGNHNAFVADTLSNTIRWVSPDGRVTTIGGRAGEKGAVDGASTIARFASPSGIAVDVMGNLYVSDALNHTIRKGVPTYLPKFASQPQGAAVKLGEKVTLSTTVAANSLTTTYQWQKDGIPITGATAATLDIANAKTTDAGSYAVVATNDLGAVTSSVANVTVEEPAPSRIVNVSIRTGITATAPMVTVGFVVGSGSKPLLVRTVGPTLKPFGVGDAITDPKLALFKGDTQMAANDNWSSATNASDIATAARQVGAFALASGAADAALLMTLNGSAYTVQATGVAGATGTALVEVYDADATNGGRLVNVSSRAQVGTGDNVLVAGFAVNGTAKKTLLIRAVGPTLASFGVTGTLSDPKIELIPAGETSAIASNDNWAGDPALVAAFTSVGAFSFTNAQSKDAALIVTVSPGSYSAKVSGVNGAIGEALVEIYELP